MTTRALQLVGIASENDGLKKEVAIETFLLKQWRMSTLRMVKYLGVMQTYV